MERKRLSEADESPSKSGGLYFSEPRTEVFSSGCTLLDCALGGGWAYGRIANLIGDKSTGKTLLAIEASANFVRENPQGKVYYAEAEAAFDKNYAASLGLPMARVSFRDNIGTVEDWYEDLVKVISKTTKERALYILDSMDALSDRAEVGRQIDDASYGMQKQKKLSELFRRLVQQLEKSKVTVLIISQVRDAIGVTFGKKHTRSGGKALDFYATHAVWLAHVGRIAKTKNKVTRVVGVQVKAKVEKNKVGMPFREASFPILFAYGVEDVMASLAWLKEVGRNELLAELGKADKILSDLPKLSSSEYKELEKKVRKLVKRSWREIEAEFLPTRKKY